MAFIGSTQTGTPYAPGYFLANNEDCTRLTYEISATGAETAANGGKYVPMGTVYPAAGANAIGLVYEDVDVTDGDMPGSVVTKGVVYEGRLPAELNSTTKNALKALGFVFITEGSVTRPTTNNTEGE